MRRAVKEGTSLGREAKRFMDQGLLVPDEIILDLIREILEGPDAERGIIMDGFPRTVAQAEEVDRLLETQSRQVDHVLSFEVPSSELIKRIIGRAQAEDRSDDTEETIGRRLDVYHDETYPLIEYYRGQGKLRKIDAQGSIEEIAARVDEALKTRTKL